MLSDLLLHRMRDVIVDPAAVHQILLDLDGLGGHRPLAFVLAFTRVAIFTLLLFLFVLICASSMVAESFNRVGLHISLTVFDFGFLQDYFGTDLLEELVRLLQDLHEPRILLRVDQVDVRVEVILLERIEPRNLLFVPLFLLLLVLLVQVRPGQVGSLFYLSNSPFVKLDKFSLPIEDLFQEFFAASAPPHLLPRPHLLLETIERAGLLLAVGEDTLAFVEVAVDQLVLVKVVPTAFAHELRVRLKARLHISLDFLPQGLLDRVQFEKGLLELGLLLDPRRRVLVLDEHLQVACELAHLIKFVGLFHV